MARLLGLWSLCALTIALLPMTSSAAQEDIRIGIVDINRALKESKAGEELKQKLEKSHSKLSGKVEKKAKEFERSKSAFMKQADSLKDSVRLKKQEELRQQKADLERMAADSRRSLQVEEKAGVEELITKLREVVSKVGRDEGFTLILEKGSTPLVLYGDRSIDITSKVVAKFDASS